MQNKTLLIGTLLLGVVTLAVLNFKGSEAETPIASTTLIDAEILNHPQRLVLKSNGKTSTIERLNDEWGIKEKFDLPIDTENRLLPLILSLQKTQNFGVLTTNAKRIEKLGLSENLLLITGENGKTFAAEIGKQTDDALGNAMRLQGETAAIRTNFAGYLEADPISWMNPILFSEKAENVESVSFKFADGKLNFSRNEKGGKFTNPEGPWVEDFITNLAIIRIADAQGKGSQEAEKAFGRSIEVKFEFFDGSTLTTTWARESIPATKEPKAFVRVQHSDPKNKVNLLSQKAEFVCPAWLIEQVPTSRADLNKRALPPTENAAPGNLNPLENTK